MMAGTIRRRIARLWAILAGLGAIGAGLGGCATIGSASDLVRQVCASGELATGLTALDATIAALEAVVTDFETEGRPVPPWLPETVAALGRDRATIAAGCLSAAL